MRLLGCHAAQVIHVEEWCRLVRGRFWSSFHFFDDAQLDAGCEHIMRTARAKAPHDSMLKFEERLLLIAARVQSES